MTGATDLVFDWMACTSIVGDTGLGSVPQLGLPTVTLPNSPFAAGSTPVYTGQLVDPYGVGIPASAFSVLTLSLVNTLSGVIVNGVDEVGILNTGRGTVDATGNLTIQFEAGDTAITDGAIQEQRSLIVDWTYATTGTSGSGRHQGNFTVQALAGP